MVHEYAPLNFAGLLRVSNFGKFGLQGPESQSNSLRELSMVLMSVTVLPLYWPDSLWYNDSPAFCFTLFTLCMACHNQGTPEMFLFSLGFLVTLQDYQEWHIQTWNILKWLLCSSPSAGNWDIEMNKNWVLLLGSSHSSWGKERTCGSTDNVLRIEKNYAAHCFFAQCHQTKHLKIPSPPLSYLIGDHIDLY